MSSLVSSLAIQKFELILPSMKKRVEYRPFLVKEEKILMLASESKNESDMFRAMKEVVSACTFGVVDVENTPLIDVEYLFLKIRSRSVGETASPALKCVKCSRVTEVKVDLSKVEPVYNDDHKTKIVVSESIILEMRYPRFNDIQTVEKYTSQYDKAISLLALCIDKVHTKEQTFNASDLEYSDVEEFVMNFNQDQLKKAMRFIETMPKLSSTVDFECSHCHHKEKVVMEGIRDFF